MENEELIEIEEIIENKDIEPEPFVIPNIYNYDGITKEFTGLVEQADKDSAKSAQVGHFVPMVHANATLLEPPKVEENQIQVYSKTIETHEEPYEVIDEDGEKHIEYKTVTEVIESWNIEPDYRKNFLKVDNDLNVSNITTIGEQEGYIIVDKAIGENIKVNKDWYKIVDKKVVKKSDEEYEQEQEKKEQDRISNLSMTRGDVFEALILAKGVTKSYIRLLIENNTELSELDKSLYLNRFDEALEFYRKYPAVDLIGKLLGIYSSQLDDFFITKDWHTLLPKSEE